MAEVLGSGDIQMPNVKVSLSMRHRVNFASRHLKSAVYAATKVRQVEVENKGKEFSDFFEEIGTNCVACLWFCTSAVEAYINEVFLSKEKCFPNHPPEFIEVIHESIDKRDIIEKLDKIIRLKNGSKVNLGAEPWQSLREIIKIRNALIHFKPEWSDEREEHGKLLSIMAKRVQKSQFMAASQEQFPNTYFSFEFCQWVIRTTILVMDQSEEKEWYVYFWEEFKKNHVLDKIRT